MSVWRGFIGFRFDLCAGWAHQATRSLLQGCAGSVESSCSQSGGLYVCGSSYYTSCNLQSDGLYCCTGQTSPPSTGDSSSGSDQPSPSSFLSSSDSGSSGSNGGLFQSFFGDQTDQQGSFSSDQETPTDTTTEGGNDGTNGDEQQQQDQSGTEEPQTSTGADTSGGGCAGTVDSSCSEVDGIYDCDNGYYMTCDSLSDGSYCCSQPTQPGGSDESQSDSSQEDQTSGGDSGDTTPTEDGSSGESGDQSGTDGQQQGGSQPTEDELNDTTDKVSQTISELPQDTVSSLLGGSTQVNKEQVDTITSAVVPEDKLDDESALENTANTIGNAVEKPDGVASAATACAWGIIHGQEKVYATSYAYTAITVIKTKTITVTYNVISSFAIAVATVYKTDPGAAQRATLAFAEALAKSGDCNIYIVQIIQVFVSVITTVTISSKEIVYVFS